jgi:RNA polymerase sigma-70 factor, ECF subfamily
VLRTSAEDRVLRDDPDGDGLRLPVAGGAAGGPGGETEAAWKEFHLRLRAFVTRRVGQRADAEDIVQKVFLEMHRSLPTLRTRDRLGAWLHRTARNAIADHYRTPARRREVPSGDTSDLDVRHPSRALMPDDDVRAVASAAACLGPMVQRLPEAYRRAIELVELRGVTQRVAAESEGVSLSGMKTRVQRARRLLKASLLQCCRVALDARGGMLSCETHRGATRACAPDRPTSTRTIPGAMKENA